MVRISPEKSACRKFDIPSETCRRLWADDGVLGSNPHGPHRAARPLQWGLATLLARSTLLPVCPKTLLQFGA